MAIVFILSAHLPLFRQKCEEAERSACGIHAQKQEDRIIQAAVISPTIIDDSVILDVIDDLEPIGHFAVLFSPLRIELSPTCAHMLGWGGAGSRTFKPADLLKLQIPGRAAHLRDIRKLAARGNEKLTISFVAIHPDGNRRQLRAAFRIQREKGAAISCMGALMDESAQRRREAGLRATLDTIPSAMIVIDADGVILAFSATAAAMFGYSEEEAVGQKIGLLMPEPHRERHASYLDRYIDSGRPRIIGQAQTLDAQRADGTIFPIELWVGDASTESERRFTGFIRDRSEQLETEAKLESLQNDLVHVARLSAVGELSLSLAHELNQPLSAIVNYLSAAEFLTSNEAGASNTKLAEIMQSASGQAMRAGEIVKRLRTFVEKGEADMRFEAVGSIIHEAASLIALTIRRKGISLKLSVANENQLVLGDRIQLQQVLLNLMRNSIEALESAGKQDPQLAISSRETLTGGVEIIVEDNGPGIGPEYLKNLFKPFSSHKPGGMGVGLSISRRILEAHGGTLSYLPRVDVGACFCLGLPAAKPEPADG